MRKVRWYVGVVDHHHCVSVGLILVAVVFVIAATVVEAVGVGVVAFVVDDPITGCFDHITVHTHE